jgi:hypothetical protein
MRGCACDLESHSATRLQGWASRKGKAALILLHQKWDCFDLTLGVEDKLNVWQKDLRLLTLQGIELLLAARVKELHAKGLRLVDVLTWFEDCFRNGPEDWSLSTVCVSRKLPPSSYTCARALTHARPKLCPWRS